MSLKHGILGFLNYSSMSGYDINKAFSQSVEFFWHAHTSQIYRELAKLESENLVTYSTIIQAGRPNKKEYCITEAGKTELFRWLLDPTENAISDFKSELLMKIFFSDAVSLQACIRRLEHFKDDCIQYSQNLASAPSTIATYREQVDNQMAPVYWGLTADYAELYVKMCITWAENSIIKLKEQLHEGSNH